GRHPVALIKIVVAPDQVDVNVHPTKTEVKFADERTVFRAVARATHAALVDAPHDDLPELTFTRLPVENGHQAEQRLDRIPSPTSGSATPPAISQVPVRQMPVLRVMGQIGSAYIAAEGPEGLYLIDQHAAHERVTYERILAQMQGATVQRQALLD